ncbi:hypothetical protein GKE82_03675 [Conexibacter sp. W3-3-2]|uniref:hypothetical protein n=1 Tax=Conexibacter sp. W3-3-2 TaxID=2675227 RepID=UPI0012B8EF91|nr:hypothetical protein [Conexibacter sp. W3-3-2]MTD43424.1 hypothetical protein [Conexibacter sp. W3-3-2]
MSASYLPAGPLAEWLRAKVAQAGDVAHVALALDLDEALLRRRMRATGRVTLAVADELFIRADEPQALAVLYPLTERAAPPRRPTSQDCELQALMAEIRADHARRGLFA